jgi:hypothetical protein
MEALIEVEDTRLEQSEQSRLVELEGVIRRGLQIFFEVGHALSEIRDKRLYRSTHSTFEEYCQDRWGMPSASARRIIGNTRVYDNLESVQRCTVLPEREGYVMPLRGLESSQQVEAWQRAVDTAPNGQITVAHVAQVVQEIRQPMAVHYTSVTPEWNTPRHIVDRVLGMFEVVDLDPCSNSHEVPNVPAVHHYTREDDGLSKPWFGYVYMNPPYGDEVGAWVEKLIHEYTAGTVALAVALVPARTDTSWFAPLWDYPCCFIRGRLKFGNGDNSAPFPSVAVYFGDSLEDFIEAFGNLGAIVSRLGKQVAA